jgi:zinc transporter ZupT
MDLYNAGLLPMIFGVTLSLAFVGGLIWFVNYKISGHLSQKEWLTRFVALMLTAFLGLFLVDKLVSFHTPLLSPEMSDGLFELIKNIVLIVFGYQFHTADKGKENTETED